MSKKKIIGVIFSIVVIVISLFTYIGNQNLSNLTPGVAFGLILIVILIPRKTKTPKVKFSIEDDLQSNGFVKSKEAKAGFYTILVDDTNKKIAVTTKNSATYYNFTDVLDYELNEDGNTVTKGKGLATIAGGAVFGLVGAIAGASGKRKNEATCTSMIVRVTLNNLETPQLVIPFISAETKKDSLIYKTNLESAKNLIAVLTYIDNQNESA